MLKIDLANWNFLECTAPACLKGMAAVYTKNNPQTSDNIKRMFAACDTFLTPIDPNNNVADPTAVKDSITDDLTRTKILKQQDPKLYQQQIAWLCLNEYHGQDDYFSLLTSYLPQRWIGVIDEFEKNHGMRYNDATVKANNEKPNDFITIWIPIKNTPASMYFKILTFVKYKTNIVMINISDRYIIRSKNVNKTKLLYGNERYYFQRQFANNIYMQPFFDKVKWQNNSRTSNLPDLINTTCDKDLLPVISQAIKILQQPNSITPSGTCPGLEASLCFMPTKADIAAAINSSPTLEQTETQLKYNISVFKRSLAKYFDTYYKDHYSDPFTRHPQKTIDLLGNTNSLSPAAKQTAQKLIGMLEGKFVMFEYEDLRVLNQGQLRPLLGELQEITDPITYRQLTTVQNYHPVIISSGNAYKDKVSQMLAKYIKDTEVRAKSCFNAKSFMGRLGGQHKTASAKYNAAKKLQNLINLNGKSESGVTFAAIDIAALNDGELKMLLIQCKPLIKAPTFARLCNSTQKGNVIVNTNGEIPVAV